MQYVCLSSPLSPSHRSSRLPAASAGKRGASFKYVRKILSILDPSFPQFHTSSFTELKYNIPFLACLLLLGIDVLNGNPIDDERTPLLSRPFLHFALSKTDLQQLPVRSFPFRLGAFRRSCFGRRRRRIKLRKNNVGQRP